MSQAEKPNEFGPWNPGLVSRLPREYLPLATIYRADNVATSVQHAHELSDFCGLAPHRLVAFRAKRLIIHELLIRITADIAVSDGSHYEDLGINFREIASAVLETYIAPHFAALDQRFEQVRSEAADFIARELSRDLYRDPGDGNSRAKSPERGWLSRLTGGARQQASPSETTEERQQRVLDEWKEKLQSAASPLETACFVALKDVVTSVTGKRGRLVGDKQLLIDIAVTLVCNRHGSQVIGDAIEPFLLAAAANEGYRLLPAQDKPIVMNVKGASAAGKSTMRPLQRALAEQLNVPWEDFALISPDIWRKFLLDYDSLGEAYKYAGTMTGHEIEIIDKKLDRYMAKKAASGRMSHLLIDRFRFDSFAPESDGDVGSNLLTRFGDLVYMFFMITPPDATVERAWKRGLKFGRYKAVDDLLDHNVEAYTGMPNLFFTWALRTEKRVFYEFLDNSVEEGQRPRTIAFGLNTEMNILDISRMIDVDRFRKININADSPQEVYVDDLMVADKNVEFLKQCARMIPVVNFADSITGRIYLRLEHGKSVWRNDEVLSGVLEHEDNRIGLEALGIRANDRTDGLATAPEKLNTDTAHTLGAWGPAG